MPEKLKIKPGTSVIMNDTVIKMESSCRYLGHMITDGLDDNEDIKTPVTFFLWLSKYATAYIQLLFSWCEETIVFLLLW